MKERIVFGLGGLAILLNGCGEMPNPNSDSLKPTLSKTLDNEQPKKFGGDPMGIASIWILLGGAGTALAGFSLLRRGK